MYATINGKAGVKYAGIEIEAMRAITDAYKARSIEKFQSVYREYAKQLADDQLIATHLQELQEKLLEQNLLRLIEPFSRVQIEHVAKLIKLERPQVEIKSEHADNTDGNERTTRQRRQRARAAPLHIRISSRVSSSLVPPTLLTQPALSLSSLPLTLVCLPDCRR